MRTPELRPVTGRPDTWRASFGGRRRYYRGERADCERQLLLDYAAWLEAGGRGPGAPARVCDLVAAFLADADARFAASPGGYGNSQARNYRAAAKWLDRAVTLPGSAAPLYLPAVEVARFGAPMLVAVREAMLVAPPGRSPKGTERREPGGRSASYVNATLSRIRGMFRWGRERGMVPREVLVDLEAVSPVRAGDPRAREAQARTEIPEAHFRAALEHVPSWRMRAMLRLLRASGMRVGEACRMRLHLLDRSEDPWRYELGREHKTGHLRERVVWLGARAQAALGPVIEAAEGSGQAQAWLFPGQSAGCPHLRPQSVSRALMRACRDAGVPHYRTHELRHTRGTEVFRRQALDAVQHALGQTSSEVAARYVHGSDLQRELARRMG